MNNVKTKLKIDTSVEIDNLMDILCERLGISWEECEERAMKEGLYPEGTKTYLTSSFGGYDAGTLQDEAIKILAIHGIQSCYVTQPI